MTKILFVCHGNICRSPMAEFVFKDMIKKANRQNDFEVASAATSTEEIGNSIHFGTRQKLTEKGIPFSNHKATQMLKSDYDYFDLIIGMDAANIRNIHRIICSDTANKVHLLLNFCGENRDVADPWYTGDFDATYNDVVKGCQSILEQF